MREEEAAISVKFENHVRVLAPIRNLPEDVLREICITCVADPVPGLSPFTTPLPYVLAQISAGIRHIALTTPIIWAQMDIQIREHYGSWDRRTFLGLVRKVEDWFDSSGGLPLTLYIDDPSGGAYTTVGSIPESNILLDALFSYSALWKEIQFKSRWEILSAPVLRFAALTNADVPLLQSVTLSLGCSLPPSLLSNIVFLKSPTLRHVSLFTPNVRKFPINWAVLTSVSLHGRANDLCYSKNEIAQIFQQTKQLVSCDIVMSPPRAEDQFYLEEVKLPFLERLRIVEMFFDLASPEAPSLLDLISAPNLANLDIDGTFLERSLLNFVKRSPNISEFRGPYLDKDKSLMFMMTLLRHCPLLSVLYLWPCSGGVGNRTPRHDANLFLRSFVEKSDVGVTCPRLQDFTFMGRIQFSAETLRLFLEGKQKDIYTLNIQIWKRVHIIVQGIIRVAETKQQILDLVSQKKLEGMPVDVRVG